MRKSALHSLLTDEAMLREIRDKGDSFAGALPVPHRKQLDELLNGVQSAIEPGGLTPAEAIVLVRGRPALVVQDGKWAPVLSKEIRDRLEPAKAALEPVIPRIGRVEILDDEADYVGTGWMIDEDVLVTNRHVAEYFAVATGGPLRLRRDVDGRPMRVRVDFLREFERDATWRVDVRDILFMEEADALRPDWALVRLARDAPGLPEPIELDDRMVAFHDHVAAIGYPAEDQRNDAFVMRELFDGVYGVKRLSPGWISGVRSDGLLLQHDCTTLGGSSGSAIINLATGKVCGLHFAGTYLDSNHAVTSAALKQRMAQLGPVRVAVPRAEAADEVKRPQSRPKPQTELHARAGYDPEFLGAGELRVPLPELGEGARAELARVDGRQDGELRYMHFSIKMRSDRRIAFFTAANIDGRHLFGIPRPPDHWSPDPRLVDAGHQTDDALYASNRLDRGHLVRRIDPAWGKTRAEAEEAARDTFFFTNCSPQHAELNQKTWLSLEDYVLGNAATHDLKVCVFTGPLFAESDREYRHVRLPEEFWKVLVIVNEFTGQLSATAYTVSQHDYLGGLEFLYGPFRTYQCALLEIGQRTGLGFDGLAQHDPMRRLEGPARREIRGPEDLVL